MSQRPQATTPPATPVVLVLTCHPSERELEPQRTEEMRSLLDTAGRNVVATVSQHLQKPVGATLIGSGKIKEVKDLVAQHGAREVAFDSQLSPSQQRNLEEELQVHVLDYDEVILDIFARNARSAQAMLAVELARSEYDRARLRRLWTHLDRQSAGGAAGAGSGFKAGTGEKQIEMDRRQVRKRIQDLKGRLDELEGRKERAIASREDCFKICLVGYTNAGKSTLMNALTRAGVLAEDRLFATLDTRTARLHLAPDGETARGLLANVVLSDTVGFIRKLPPTLIASFHATLAEVREADLLLHVVDSSSAVMEQQITAVEEVLEQIGAAAVPALVVFNKSDRSWSKTMVAAYRKRYRHAVSVSALSGDGIDRLKDALRDVIGERCRTVTVRVPIADGQLQAFLRSRAHITDEQYEDDFAVLTLAADARLMEEMKQHPALVIEGA